MTVRRPGIAGRATTLSARASSTAPKSVKRTPKPKKVYEFPLLGYPIIALLILLAFLLPATIC